MISFGYDAGGNSVVEGEGVEEEASNFVVDVFGEFAFRGDMAGDADADRTGVSEPAAAFLRLRGIYALLIRISLTPAHVMLTQS